MVTGLRCRSDSTFVSEESARPREAEQRGPVAFPKRAEVELGPAALRET